MQFSLNIHCEFSLFLYMFSVMRRWNCFVDVRAEAETEALADVISVLLVSIPF